MQTLRIYLNSLPVKEQAEFALKCKTTINYLRKAISKNQNISAELSIRIDGESRGAVSAESLRPDVPWHVIRNNNFQPTSETH